MATWRAPDRKRDIGFYDIGFVANAAPNEGSS
jgi:hypothetical protein